MSEWKCSVTVFGERVSSWQCQRNGTVERGGKWYCRQHDPESVAAKNAARDAKWKAERDAENAIWAEADAVVKELGCGSPHFHRGVKRAIVLSLDDARALIKRLAAGDEQ